MAALSTLGLTAAQVQGCILVGTSPGAVVKKAYRWVVLSCFSFCLDAPMAATARHWTRRLYRPLGGCSATGVSADGAWRAAPPTGGPKTNCGIDHERLYFLQEQEDRCDTRLSCHTSISTLELYQASRATRGSSSRISRFSQVYLLHDNCARGDKNRCDVVSHGYW